MPFLDVDDVISDPNFSTTFTVIRRVSSVNSHGEATTIVAQTIPLVVGVVTPTGSNSLVRQDAFETQTNAIQVITAFRLRAASKDASGTSWLPDLIQYDGDYYVVRTMNEFTQFGEGFVVSECIQIAWNAAPSSEAGAPTTLDASIAGNSGIKQQGWI